MTNFNLVVSSSVCLEDVFTRAPGDGRCDVMFKTCGVSRTIPFARTTPKRRRMRRWLEPQPLQPAERADELSMGRRWKEISW